MTSIWVSIPCVQGILNNSFFGLLAFFEIIFRKRPKDQNAESVRTECPLAEAASAERPFGLIGQGLLLLHSFLKSQIRSSVFYLPKIPEH